MPAETTLDNNEKLIIFSDTHLRIEVEEKKFNFMEKIIKGANRVIINGDFWDGYKINFSQFVCSPWKHLFPLLREKKSIYLIGDHDKETLCDDRSFFFSDKRSERVMFKNNGDIFLVEHGDKWFKTIAKNKFVQSSGLVGAYVKAEEAFLKKFGKDAIKLSRGRYNEIIKSRIPETLKDNQILVTGHTHVGEIDFKNRYLNDGIFGRAGFAQWLVFEKNKAPQLKEEFFG